MKLILSALIICLAATQAYACEQGPMSHVRAIEKIKDIRFAGKVRILEIDEDPEFNNKQKDFYYSYGLYPIELTLESVETYVGEPFDMLKVYAFNADSSNERSSSSCAKGIQMVGQVYEEAIMPQSIAASDIDLGWFAQEKPTLFREETWAYLRKMPIVPSDCVVQGDHWEMTPPGKGEWVNKFNCVKASEEQSRKD